jgi:hypothetical protein
MLKITTKVAAGKVTFELEGRLAGPWVDELEQCWREVPVGYTLTVSLNAVTFIDNQGKALLGKLHDSGADLQATGCMTRCIVQEITTRQAPKVTYVGGRHGNSRK